MGNDTLTLPRVENSASTRVGRNNGCLSKDFENIIQRIERLRFPNARESVDSSGRRTRDATQFQTSDQRLRNGDSENDDDDLVERGPMKTQLLLPTRSQPYSTINGFGAEPVRPSENFILGCNQTTDQNNCWIKDCNDLNVYSSKFAKVPRENCGNDGSDLRHDDVGNSFEFAPTTLLNIPSADSLLDIIPQEQGMFQPAQSTSAGGLFPFVEISSSKVDCLDPSLLAGESKTRFANLPTDSSAWPGSLQPGKHNFTTNLSPQPPFSSSEASPFLHRVYPCNCSPASTSSNESYGNEPSPVGYNTPLDPGMGDQLGNDLNSIVLANACNSLEPSVVENVQVATAAPPIGPIDSSELQLVEEVITSMTAREIIDSAAYAEIMCLPNYNRSNEPNLYPVNSSPPPSLPTPALSSPLLLPTPPIPDSADKEVPLYEEKGGDVFEKPKFVVPAPKIFKNNFEIPEVVVTLEQERFPRQQRNSVWQSLNMPAVDASERLKRSLNPKEVQRAMSDLLKRSVEELAEQDADGDTMLMRLVGNPKELTKKKAYLAPLVERLSAVKGALSIANNQGFDALYLAAHNCPGDSYATGYLAAMMLQNGIDISQLWYHSSGDTLVHSIAAEGDSHKEVLEELLGQKTNRGTPLFDLSELNNTGKTPLHVAVESHESAEKKITCLGTVRLLLKSGANPWIKDGLNGDTVLHKAVSSSCDPALVKEIIPVAYGALCEPNYKRDTPLHVATALSSSIPLTRQREVCRLLIDAGAETDLTNCEGKTPLDLVLPERKDEIRKLFFK